MCLYDAIQLQGYLSSPEKDKTKIKIKTSEFLQGVPELSSDNSYRSSGPLRYWSWTDHLGVW